MYLCRRNSSCCVSCSRPTCSTVVVSLNAFLLRSALPSSSVCLIGLENLTFPESLISLPQSASAQGGFMRVQGAYISPKNWVNCPHRRALHKEKHAGLHKNYQAEFLQTWWRDEAWAKEEQIHSTNQLRSALSKHPSVDRITQKLSAPFYMHWSSV